MSFGPFRVQRTREVEELLDSLEREDPKRYAKVGKTLGLLARDPRHPGLNSHEFQSYPGYGRQKVWESYVENRTPGAWRVFWIYGPERGEITVIAITPHV